MNYKQCMLPLMLMVAVSTMSCTAIKSVTRTIQESQYLGNTYKEMKGYTENQILRSMASPTRTESDGAGGKVLVYENKQLVTDSKTSHITQSSTQSAATVTAGTNVWTGAPQVNESGTSNTTTAYNTANKAVTYEEKAYVNFFINSEGICYDVTTNIGDKYSDAVTETICYKVPKELSPLVLFTLIPPATLVGIPMTIAYFVTKKKAKNFQPSPKDIVECQ